MGFSPKLIVADVSLIISIALAFFIQKSGFPSDVKIGLLILASIFLLISVVSNFIAANERRKNAKKIKLWILPQLYFFYTFILDHKPSAVLESLNLQDEVDRSSFRINLWQLWWQADQRPFHPQNPTRFVNLLESV